MQRPRRWSASGHWLFHSGENFLNFYILTKIKFSILGPALLQKGHEQVQRALELDETGAPSIKVWRGTCVVLPGHQCSHTEQWRESDQSKKPERKSETKYKPNQRALMISKKAKPKKRQNQWKRNRSDPHRQDQLAAKAAQKRTRETVDPGSRCENDWTDPWRTIDCWFEFFLWQGNWQRTSQTGTARHSAPASNATRSVHRTACTHKSN